MKQRGLRGFHATWFMPLNASTAATPHERLHQAEGIDPTDKRMGLENF
ncbi:MAG: hypothetical protein V7K88_25250 [Nostoc sp.]